jgi:hypothetical protein
MCLRIKFLPTASSGAYIGATPNPVNVTPPPFEYMKNAMLLALVTAQREGDISKMQFTDVWDGHLHVEQIKTGAKVAIPLSLRCDAIGMTLEQVIAQCRDHIVSPYLVHYTHNKAMARRGGMVKANTISTSFKKFGSYRGCHGTKNRPLLFMKFGRFRNAYTESKKLIPRIY